MSSSTQIILACTTAVACKDVVLAAVECFTLLLLSWTANSGCQRLCFWTHGPWFGATQHESVFDIWSLSCALPLQKSAYWSSWALTHFSTMAVSGVLCAIIGLYPFRHSSIFIMLGFYWLLACALISFSYFLSTIFSKSRVAGTVTAVLYALAMIPG